MSVLQHINIVAFLAVILEDGHYGIVMEYVLHGALDEFIRTYIVRCSVSGSYKCISLALDINFELFHSLVSLIIAACS